MTNSDEIHPWNIEWNQEQVRRFWNWKHSIPGLENLAFSKMVGDDLIDQVEKVIPVEGLIIDFGAARGFLTEKLLHRGHDVLSIDSSDFAIDQLDKRFGQTQNFKGGYVFGNDTIPVKDNNADVFFLIETVEHLIDEVLKTLLADINRVVKPEKYIVVTTPNTEDLLSKSTMCPNCGGIFHQHQHVRSFSADQLIELFNNFGFRPIKCGPILLSHYKKQFRPLHKLKYKITRSKLPHLLYIGMKISNM